MEVHLGPNRERSGMNRPGLVEASIDGIADIMALLR
jgi:hypothetical protein